MLDALRPSVLASSAAVRAEGVPTTASSIARRVLLIRARNAWTASPLVTGSKLTEAPPELRWQNATYAVQWVLFAAFVAFLWQRWFRDELRERREEQATREREPAGT